MAGKSKEQPDTETMDTYGMTPDAVKSAFKAYRTECKNHTEDVLNKRGEIVPDAPCPLPLTPMAFDTYLMDNKDLTATQIDGLRANPEYSETWSYISRVIQADCEIRMQTGDPRGAQMALQHYNNFNKDDKNKDANTVLNGLAIILNRCQPEHMQLIGIDPEVAKNVNGTGGTQSVSAEPSGGTDNTEHNGAEQEIQEGL